MLAQMQSMRASMRMAIALTVFSLACSAVTTMIASSLKRVVGPFPLDGPGFAAPSFQLRPVSHAASKRVPPNNAVSRFVGFGDKGWDSFKNSFQTRGIEFLLLSQRARRAAFGGSMAPKTPVLKLNRPLARKPPAAIVSESTRAARAPFAKPQVASLHHRWAK